MKRFLAVTLAALLLLTAASCGKTETDGTAASTDETAESTESTESTAETTAYTPAELNYPDGFDYTALDITKYVRLGKYKGLTVTLTTSSEITDADIKTYIEDVRTQHSRTVEITDRPARNGDELVIDYTGTLNGVAFEGGTATGATLTLGNGGWIDGFEEGMVGMTVGETKTIDATFPDPYKNNEELAGKTVQFEITLHSISETVIPEYNDAFVRENFEYATMAEYEAYVRETLAAQRQDEIAAEKQSATLAVALDNAEALQYPDGVVDDYMAQQTDYVRYYASMYGMSYEDFVSAATGVDVATYEADIRAAAEQSVKEEMVIYAIAEAENMTISETRREEELKSLLEYYGYDDLASMCEAYGFTEDYMQKTLTYSIYYVDVLDLLVENATFTGAK